MSDVKIWGRVRQLLQGIDQGSVGDDEQLALTEQLAQLIAIDSSQYGEIYKIGRSFEVHTTSAAAGLLSTSGLPTTANLLQLYNGEPQTNNGRSYFIDRIWAMMFSTAGTVAEQAAVICAPGQTAVAAPSSAGLAINQLNSNGGRDTRAVLGTGILDAATGVIGNWRVAPGQNGGAKVGVAATPGMFMDAQVNGRIILPPGRAMGIHVIADTATPIWVVGVEWHEKLVRLG